MVTQVGLVDMFAIIPVELQRVVARSSLPFLIYSHQWIYIQNHKSSRRLWSKHVWLIHYSAVIMCAMTSQITGVSIVCSTVGSGTDKRKHQRSESLAFLWGIHRWPVNSSHKWPITRKVMMLLRRNAWGRIDCVFVELRGTVVLIAWECAEQRLRGNGGYDYASKPRLECAGREWEARGKCGSSAAQVRGTAVPRIGGSRIYAGLALKVLIQLYANKPTMYAFQLCNSHTA